MAPHCIISSSGSEEDDCLPHPKPEICRHRRLVIGWKITCTEYLILSSIIISVTAAPLLSLYTILSHHNAYYQLTTIKLNVVRGMHNSSLAILPSVLMSPRPSSPSFSGQWRSRLTALERLRNAATAHVLIYGHRRICKSKSYLVNKPLVVFHA